jgi:hypothetical protein
VDSTQCPCEGACKGRFPGARKAGKGDEHRSGAPLHR